MGKKNVIVLSFLLFAFWFFALAALYPEEAYPILEPELSRLETIWQDSQADKQNWLSQVQKLQQGSKKLQTQVAELKMDSENLNSQLSAERDQTEVLRKSYERSELEKNSIILEKQNQIDVLKDEKSKIKIDLEKVKKQRDVASIFLGVLVLGLIGYIYVKSRYKKLF